MYNEFAKKHYKGKWPCTTDSLYNEKTLIGRLHKYFSAYFETFSAPSAEMLFLLILSILALESAHSIRFLYRHFLSGITTNPLNAFYYACSYAKVDCSGFMNVTAKNSPASDSWISKVTTSIYLYWWYNGFKIRLEIWKCIQAFWPCYA